MRGRDITINLGVTIEHLWQGGLILVFILIAIGGFFGTSYLIARSVQVIGTRVPTQIEAYGAIMAMIITGIVSRLIQRKLKNSSSEGEGPPPQGIR